MMQFFIAGIMQGSHRTAVLHDQHYRARLREQLTTHFPGARIYDPLVDHGGSLGYDDVQARAVFYQHNRMCREVDVVIAFVPEASMGTAVEMWEAHEHGRGIVIAISPLLQTWAVKYCSHLQYADWESFESELASGELSTKIERLLREKSAALPAHARHPDTR